MCNTVVYANWICNRVDYANLICNRVDYARLLSMLRQKNTCMKEIRERETENRRSKGR